jgi:hypothetical protein
MRKYILVVLLVGAILLLCGCNANKTSEQQKYMRISFESETLGEVMGHVKDDTIIINDAKETYETKIPVYEIKERTISDQECEQMMETLEIPEDPSIFTHDDNMIHIRLVTYTDFSRGFFDMTEDEAEKQAWKIFEKIPFIEGEYECIGIRETMTLSDKDGTHITIAGVTFCRVLDGMRVTGNDSCTIYLDGTGFAGVFIRMFEYEKVGTMDMISLKEAGSKLKNPDDFDIETEDFQLNQKVETIRVDHVYVRLVNQYARGCTILQPIYFYKGIATLVDKTQVEFSSKIIAIPESITYEE